MATAARTLLRAAARTTPTRSAVSVGPRGPFRHSSSNSWRFYSSSSSSPPPPPPRPQGVSLKWILGVGAGGLGAAAVFTMLNPRRAAVEAEAEGPFVPEFGDYQAVYNEVAGRLEEDPDYDDGSYGPVLLRLAWHASGTYDKLTGTGGSNGATMRFAPEAGHGANAGLKAARDFLVPVKGE